MIEYLENRLTMEDLQKLCTLAGWKKVSCFKKDSEIKLLLGCIWEEKETVYRFHNESEHMKGILIEREKPAGWE